MKYLICIIFILGYCSVLLGFFATAFEVNIVTSENEEIHAYIPISHYYFRNEDYNYIKPEDGSDILDILKEFKTETDYTTDYYRDESAGYVVNEDNVFHMKRELGDIIWYWINACIALGFDPNEVIEENVRKLEARYPGGKFSVWHSENRQEGDL